MAFFEEACFSEKLIKENPVYWFWEYLQNRINDKSINEIKEAIKKQDCNWDEEYH